MKKWNRYAASFLALIGLIFLFFPVFRAGETGITVVELMAYWKKKNLILAIWTAAAVAAPAITVLLNSFGKKKLSLNLSVIIEIFHGISILLLCGLRAGGVIWLDWVGTGAIICQLLSALFCGMEILCLKRVEEQKRCQQMREEKQQQEEQRRKAEEKDRDAQRKAGEEQGWGAQRRVEEEQDWNEQRRVEEEQGRDTQRKAEEQLRKKQRQQVLGGEERQIPQGSLKIGCGMYLGSSIPLGHMQTVTIGRDASQCNLVVDGAAVSRKHCTVTYNAVGNKYLLLDTSTNGTYLEGGQRIPKSFAMELTPGLKFYLGVPENWFRLGK